MRFSIGLLLAIVTSVTAESYLDSIYGEVTGPSIHLENVGEIDEFSLNHEFGYNRIKSKLNLPSDDDTSDLDGLLYFGGIVTYGHRPHLECFNPDNDTLSTSVDIAVVGAPFDTGVSYRTGARFGPNSIRSALRRMEAGDGTYGQEHRTKKSIIDCGDVPMTPFDNRIALNQLYRGQRAIHRFRSDTTKKSTKIITLGGDHTVSLMCLKSAFETYKQPLHVIHFDSHLDTWNPKVLGGGISHYMLLNHGTFLHYALEKGYIATENNIHVGLRAPFIDFEYDPVHDAECGFKAIGAREIDRIGIRGILHKIHTTIPKDAPVYITVDIDVLDPSSAPGTGTMEVGGWTTRELLSVLDGLKGLNVVGADVVEVSPPFDTNSEITSLAATAVIESFILIM
ncbi:uncharacterized protein KQ657_003366 [Scheffersomyces spartinae]|uniref:Agmatinase n=1 Tax=Scheffersomyces spartinae TaxID=45513 RepID=A0A9P7VCZ5_9ASCO|nr:uncharacterized protein KQ657_003366 [Scheffersomyces spartinae]KAG7195599.1 hypothetical protein KQ657_003366 [Scheffersomyces spartinae]